MLNGSDRSLPAVKLTLSLAGAFTGCLRLRHPLRHLRLHSVEVKTRAPLHRRVIKERLKLFRHHLLDEDKAPELVFEPIEVLLRTFFRSVVRPTLTLERIQPEVGDIRHINMGFFAQPAAWLIDKPEFVIVDTNCANRTFAEIKDFMTVRWTFAGDRIHLVVPIEVVLVGPLAQFHPFE